MSSFPQPLQPAETETDSHKAQRPCLPPQGTRTIGGPRQVDLSATSSRRNKVRVTPTPETTRPKILSPTVRRQLDKKPQNFLLSLVHLRSLSINHHHQPPPRDSRSVRLGNHSTQSISSGCLFFPFPSIFNRNGLCSTIHRLDQGRCRRPEGCRQRPWPAQRSPALLQIRPRRCRLLLDNTRCPHPRRCVRRFFLTRAQFLSPEPPKDSSCFSFATDDASATPAVAGRSSIQPGTKPALRTTTLTNTMITASRPVSSSTLPPTTEA